MFLSVLQIIPFSLTSFSGASEASTGVDVEEQDADKDAVPNDMAKIDAMATIAITGIILFNI